MVLGQAAPGARLLRCRQGASARPCSLRQLRSSGGCTRQREAGSAGHTRCQAPQQCCSSAPASQGSAPSARLHQHHQAVHPLLPKQARRQQQLLTSAPAGVVWGASPTPAAVRRGQLPVLGALPGARPGALPPGPARHAPARGLRALPGHGDHAGLLQPGAPGGWALQPNHCCRWLSCAPCGVVGPLARRGRRGRHGHASLSEAARRARWKACPWPCRRAGSATPGSPSSGGWRTKCRPSSRCGLRSGAAAAEQRCRVPASLQHAQPSHACMPAGSQRGHGQHQPGGAAPGGARVSSQGSRVGRGQGRPVLRRRGSGAASKMACWRGLTSHAGHVHHPKGTLQLAGACRSGC